MTLLCIINLILCFSIGIVLHFRVVQISKPLFIVSFHIETIPV